MIVIILPLLQRRSHVVERFELMDVQTLVPQPSVERLDHPVLDRLPRSNEIEPNPVLVTPLVEHLRREFRSVIDTYRNRPCVSRTDCSASTTLWPVNAKSAGSAMDSRFHLSMTVSTRYLRPEVSWSWTKSIAQNSPSRSGTSAGPRCRLRRFRRRTLIRTWSPPAYTADARGCARRASPRAAGERGAARNRIEAAAARARASCDGSR